MREFKDWFWGKFEEWRKGTTNGPTAFARFLGLPQPRVTEWLMGKTKPKSHTHIERLAGYYPDVYEALGLESPKRTVSVDQLPEELRDDFDRAMTELRRLFEEEGIDPSTEDGIKRISTILSKHGFTITIKR